jgi:hypothetical protein
MPLVSRRFVGRAIEPADREKHVSRFAPALERGDEGKAEIIRRQFDQWEKEQGLDREELMCPVCSDGLLTPTARGTQPAV